MESYEKTLIQIRGEMDYTIRAVKEISANEEVETLFPIGGGVLVKAKVLSADKLIMGVGAKVSLEKRAVEVVNFLESRIKEIEMNIGDVSAKRQQLGAQLEGVRQQAAKMMQSVK